MGGRGEGEDFGWGWGGAGGVHVAFSPRWWGDYIDPPSRWAAAGEGVEEQGWRQLTTAAGLHLETPPTSLTSATATAKAQTKKRYISKISTKRICHFQVFLLSANSHSYV